MEQAFITRAAQRVAAAHAVLHFKALRTGNIERIIQLFTATIAVINSQEMP